MSERQLQFRVGMFVLMAMIVGAALIVQFSDMKSYWQKTYAIAIHFEEAPGIQPGSPVKQNGLDIGAVSKVMLDEEQGGVLIVVNIYEDHLIRVDAEASLSRSLFGESKISFTSGTSEETIPPNSKLVGTSPSDPMEMVQRLEMSVNNTLTTFNDTTSEWQLVGQNINKLLATKEDKLDDLIQQSAVSLATFNRTMNSASVAFEQSGKTLEAATATIANANLLISDPQMQRDLRRTAAALPKIAEETQMTINAARTSIQQVSANLDVINAATAPLAAESGTIVRKLSGSLIQLEALLTELNQFSQVLNDDNGSMQQFVKDPELYRNLNRSSLALNVLLENLAPIMKDARIFSDRIARHPEILGISGAMKGSSGIKEPEEIQRTGYTAPPGK